MRHTDSGTILELLLIQDMVPLLLRIHMVLLMMYPTMYMYEILHTYTVHVLMLNISLVNIHVL